MFGMLECAVELWLFFEINWFAMCVWFMEVCRRNFKMSNVPFMLRCDGEEEPYNGFDSRLSGGVARIVVEIGSHFVSPDRASCFAFNVQCEDVFVLVRHFQWDYFRAAWDSAVIYLLEFVLSF